MFRFITLALVFGSLRINAFMAPVEKSSILTQTYASKMSSDDIPQKLLASGTIIEFIEKKRMHAGKIITVQHKSNGAARYDVEDHDGHKFNIADKAVSYSMPISANEERNIKKIFDEFAATLEEPETKLRSDLDISPELLEMAWEEKIEDELQELTPDYLIDLIHSHTASKLETYRAWKLLRTDMAHVFFKELKDHGRVVAFKAKAQKAVDAAKETYCKNPNNAMDEFCWV